MENQKIQTQQNTISPEYLMNGWDLIAAIKQKTINSQLLKLDAIPIKKKGSIPFLGAHIKYLVDITITAPQIMVKPGSGRQVDVIFPASGSITLGTTKIPLKKGQQFIVTTQLLQIEAKIQPHKGQNKTTYDLILDLESKDVIVNMSLQIPSPELAALIEILKLIVQKDIGNGKDYKLSTFSLSNKTATELKPLLPHTADFSFVEDPVNKDESNFLVLMLTNSTAKGNIYFNAPLLPPNQDSMTLLSNKIFITDFVRPGIIKGIQKDAKNPATVANQIRVQHTGGELYKIYNDGNIDLNKDHDPWINTFDGYVDPVSKQLYLYLDAKANATFMNVHVDSWVKSFHLFSIKNIQQKQEINLKQTSEKTGSSTSMEWWKWLIAALISTLTFGIGIIVTAIIYIVVSEDVPSLGGTFEGIGKDLVQWPNQKDIQLKSIEMPGNIALFVQVDFHP